MQEEPMLELSNVKLPLNAGLAGEKGRSNLFAATARALGIDAACVREVRLLKRSVDARKKSDVHFTATLAVGLAPEARRRVRPARGVNVRDHEPYPALDIPQLAGAADGEGARPVVAGMGPAGLFCALYLAEAGLRPLVVERGACVEERLAAVEAFASGGELDERTNIQFGEGGAGTFSDGKLTTGTKSPHIRHVLQAFVDAGAPEEILWQAKPHIGTDKLPEVVRALRRRIEAAGGEVRFLTRLAGVEMSGGALCAVELEDVRTGARERACASRLVLACGHSARDAFAMVREAGLALQRKPFSMGVRIEHPQRAIDRAQYGKAAGHAALGAADYKLAVHVPDAHAKDAAGARGQGAKAAQAPTRGVYTFCMCPGGTVVAAASEEGGVVVNGMSRFARDGENANSALLADVRPDDLPGDDVLAGVDLQRKVERAAFAAAERAGGAPYAAPAQTVGDFLARRAGAASSKVRPSYPRGVAWCDLHECLPDFVAAALEAGLPLLDAKLHGFADAQAVMTGVETRSSSPVRIVRGKNLQALFAHDAVEGFDPKNPPCGASGIYPCGEGAGYAGGIMSAATDGLRVAEAIAAEYAL